MPNPLTLTQAAPKSTAKAESAARESGAPQKNAQFTDVLNQQDPTFDPDPVPEATEESVALPEVEVETGLPDIDPGLTNPMVAIADSPNVAPASTTVEAVALTENPTKPAAAAGAQTPPHITKVSHSLSEIALQAPAPAPLTTPELAIETSAQNLPTNVAFTATSLNTVAIASGFAQQTVSADPAAADTTPVLQNISYRDVQTGAPAPSKSAPSPVIMNRGVSPAQIQLLATAMSPEVEGSRQSETSEVPSVTTEDPIQSVSRDVPSSPSPMAQAARAEAARAIAGQIAAAIQTRPGSGAVEIALNPEELGRVSIVLNGREDGFYVTIAAERPETLDLMRRHISILNSEFQKLGYTDLSFDLGTSSDPDQNSPEDHAPGFQNTSAEDVDGTQANSIPRNTDPDKGIDMRL